MLIWARSGYALILSLLPASPNPEFWQVAMSTTSVAPARKLRADDIFFPAMAAIVLAVIVIGFAQSYFFAGMVFAPLPNWLVHVHGALFVSWIFLFTIQPFLIAARKIKLHRRLGVLALVFPPLMAVFGVVTLFDSIRRNGTGIPASLILLGDLEELALFLWLTGWGLLRRRDGAAHKRLMMLGTIAITGPAINRWPFPPAIRLSGTIAVYVGLLAIMIVYDLWSRRKLHRCTVIGVAVSMLCVLTLPPLSSLPVWNPVIARIMHH
ncbi:hypothetical protein [Silvibacterium sp.]|uniref:hypothetical protein n=1 Tax=Silvibacterium sp. TaxID=1964179 RepID=UPI0039E55E57